MNQDEEKQQMMATDLKAMGNVKPQKTWFFERGDGKVFAMEEVEAWELLYNRSTWKRKDFKMLGVSDGTVYAQIIRESKAKAVTVGQEFEVLVKEMQDYQKAEHRLRIDEAIDMDDRTDPVNAANIDKILRLQGIIKKIEVKVNAKEKELKSLTNDLISTAFDAELAAARGHLERPGQMNIMTPGGNKRGKILEILSDRD